MAIWQFNFFVIPNSKAMKFKLEDRKVQSIEEVMCWNNYHLKDSSIKDLSKVLEPTKSWTDSIELFGSLEQTCVELYHEKDILEEVSVRLDLRNLSLDILEAVISFIKSNDAVILLSNGLVINPVIKDIVIEIRKSEAYSFLNNPEAFLLKLREK